MTPRQGRRYNLHLILLAGFSACVRTEEVDNDSDREMVHPCVLTRIRNEDRELYDRIMATRKLTDQTVLAAIAKNDKDMEVRIAAVSKLKGQARLAEIAEHDEIFWVRQELTEQLNRMKREE